MYRIVIVLLFGLMVSCGTKVTSSPFDLSNLVTTEKLDGKWKTDYLNVVAYLDADLEKIVLSDGCTVVSADYKQVSQAINFVNVVKTQSTCKDDVTTLNLNQILEQTVFIKYQSKNQFSFLNQDNQSLLILNKN